MKSSVQVFTIKEMNKWFQYTSEVSTQLCNVNTDLLFSTTENKFFKKNVVKRQIPQVETHENEYTQENL